MFADEERARLEEADAADVAYHQLRSRALKVNIFAELVIMQNHIVSIRHLAFICEIDRLLDSLFLKEVFCYFLFFIDHPLNLIVIFF